MNAVESDLKKLSGRAYHTAEWAEDVLRRYHAAIPKLSERAAQQLRPLYDWLFIPPTLWPFNIQDGLLACLARLEKSKRLNPALALLIELLPEPPSDKVCEIVANHEHFVQKGTYENFVRMQAKYAQNELTLRANPELRRQWARLKSTFDVSACRDDKGVIRRTMVSERNLRPEFTVNARRPEQLFQAAFDAFCLRWNLYGMQDDKPLLLKLAVNITPYGTLIHIPAYWSFDTRRDIRWNEIAKLHRARVQGRQGSALAEGKAQRMKDAGKLRRLDREAARRGLKGEAKHEFLCGGLAWVPETSPKRLARLRKEFKRS